MASYPPVIAHLAKRFRKCSNSFDINRRKVKTGSVLSTSMANILLMWKVNSFKRGETTEDNAPPVSCRLECHCMKTEAENPKFITSHCYNRCQTLYHLWLDNIKGQLKFRGLKNPILRFKSLCPCWNMERPRSAHPYCSIPRSHSLARLFAGRMARGHRERDANLQLGRRC